MGEAFAYGFGTTIDSLELRKDAAKRLLDKQKIVKAAGPSLFLIGRKAVDRDHRQHLGGYQRDPNRIGILDDAGEDQRRNYDKHKILQKTIDIGYDHPAQSLRIVDERIIDAVKQDGDAVEAQSACGDRNHILTGIALENLRDQIGAGKQYDA